MGPADGNSRQGLEPGVDLRRRSERRARCDAVGLPRGGDPVHRAAGGWRAAGRSGPAATRRSAGCRDRRAVHPATARGDLVAATHRDRRGPAGTGHGPAGHRAPRPDRGCAGTTARRPGDRRLCGRRDRRGHRTGLHRAVVGLGCRALGTRRGDPVDPRTCRRRAHPARRPLRRGDLERPAPRVDRVRDRRRHPARRPRHRHESVPVPVRPVDRADPGRRPVHGPAAGPARDAGPAPARPGRRRDRGGTGARRGRHPRRRAPGADAPRPATRYRRRHRGRRHRARPSRIDCGRSAATCGCRSSTTWASGRRSTGSSSGSSGWPAARSASNARTARGRRRTSSSPSSASRRRRWPTR